jgi:hypothetical protein
LGWDLRYDVGRLPDVANVDLGLREDWYRIKVAEIYEEDFVAGILALLREVSSNSSSVPPFILTIMLHSYSRKLSDALGALLEWGNQLICLAWSKGLQSILDLGKCL